MEYMVEWKDKNSEAKHFVALRDYGAKLVCDLLEENGYEYKVTESKPLDLSKDVCPLCKSTQRRDREGGTKVATHVN